MIYVQHHSTPPRKLSQKFNSFTPSNKEEATSSWKSFTGKDELTSNLNYIQKGLCAYCEIKLNSGLGTHIEHIQPKSIYHSLTFEYSNLVLSCFSSENINKNDSAVTCGHFKQNSYNPELFTPPTDVDCNNYFTCTPLGKIEPKKSLSTNDKAKAIYTRDILNLNSLRLVRLRANIIEEGLMIISELQNDKNALEHFKDLEFSIAKGMYLFPFINVRKEYFEDFK